MDLDCCPVLPPWQADEHHCIEILMQCCSVLGLMLTPSSNFAGPKRPKLAMLSAVRQKSATAVKQALSSLHDAGAPEVRDLDPAAPAAPSTLASQLPMASAEEGTCPCILCHASDPMLPRMMFTVEDACLRAVSDGREG